MFRFLAALLVVASALMAQTGSLPEPVNRAVDYEKDVAPLLQSRCLPCHGPAQQQSGLRLDNREAALRGGYTGAVIVPGKSGESRLIRLVAGLEKTTMPPVGAKLTADEIGLLR